MSARQKISSKTKRRALLSQTENLHDPTNGPGPAISKLDKTGLYDLQQVKRVLDDHVIAVRVVNGSSKAVTVLRLIVEQVSLPSQPQGERAYQFF